MLSSATGNDDPPPVRFVDLTRDTLASFYQFQDGAETPQMFSRRVFFCVLKILSLNLNLDGMCALCVWLVMRVVNQIVRPFVVS